jgi:hypothetical protein
LFALPVAVANLTLPSYVQIPIVAGYFMVHIIHDLATRKEGSLPFSQGTYETIFTGIGTAFLYRAVKETYDVARQQKGANVISIAIYLAVSSYFISKLALHRDPTFGPSAATSAATTPTLLTREATLSKEAAAV